MFAALHVKSARSPGYGTSAVGELVRRAASHGYAALGLTDVENLYGQVELHHAARAHALRAVTGVELRSSYGAHTLGRKPGRLVLWARDSDGYESLCRIVTRRRASSTPTGDPLGCLDDAPRGLLFASDDASVLAALRERGLAREELRFLLVRPDPAARLAQARVPEGVAAVADTDAVLLDAADHDLHRLLVAIRLRETFEAVAPMVEPPERCLPTPERLRELFRDAPEALAESERIARACTLDLT